MAGQWAAACCEASTLVLCKGLLHGLKQAGKVGFCKLLAALFLMPVSHRMGPPGMYKTAWPFNRGCLP